jgi:DNA recombination-dependent growth factor C
MQQRSDELGPELESRKPEKPWHREVPRNLEDEVADDLIARAFRRYTRAAAALIARGECDA